MIYDPRRFAGILAAVTAMAAASGLYGLILNASLRPAERWLHERDQTFNVSLSTELGSRRILAIRRDQATPKRAAKRLGVLVGPSVLRQGVDSAGLTAQLGGDYRWANVTSPAMTHELNLLVKLMYRSGLRPDVLIVVGNPAMVVADRDTHADRVWYDPHRLFDHLAHRQLELARADLNELSRVPWRLAFPHRGQVFTAFDRLLTGARLRMFQAGGGLGIDDLYAPDDDPWVEPYTSYEHTTDGTEFLLGYIGRKGWFDPALYREDTQNFHLLCEIFRIAHEHGTRCFLMIAAESTHIRKRMPSDAAGPLVHGLPRVLGAAAPIILDYREAFPDDAFIDANHLSPAGRERMTTRLARDLKGYLVEPSRGHAPDAGSLTRR